MAQFALHGVAHSNVQLDLAPASRVSRERRRDRTYTAFHDIIDERGCYLAALQNPPRRTLMWGAVKLERHMNEQTAEASTPDAGALEPTPRAEVKSLSFFYGKNQALKSVSLPLYHRKVTSLIGPSGCGKSTLLRCFNRLHDLYPNNRYEGEIRLYPEDINIVSKDVDPMYVRLRIGMVFQKPNPFPKSIYENVAAGLRIRGVRDRSILDERVNFALRQAALWDEVKDRLQESANGLSGGQQQRLCIARTLAPDP